MASKKFWLVLLMAILVLSGAFASPTFKLSVGGGIFADLGTGGGFESSTEKVEVYMPGIAGGGFAFFDATYAELSLGFSGGLGRILIHSENHSINDDPYLSITSFNISLLGKYPFEIGTKWTIFPLLGIDYQLMLSVEDEYGVKASDFNALWFKLGAGFDRSFTEQIYLRFSTLYGIRLPNQLEKDAVDQLDASVLLGQGLTIKLAIGYRF